MNQYFRNAIISKGLVPARYIDKVSARADDNLRRYYSLLHSTGVDGIADLVTAIHDSTFTTCRSRSHHNYTTGTMEHCLGVYDEMMAQPDAIKFDRNDIILVALLHDIGKASSKVFSSFTGHHPERSEKIVRHYLPNVSPEVLNAIRYHQHHSSSHPLQNLVCDADHHDASKCNHALSFFEKL